jgi:hypothetical protein
METPLNFQRPATLDSATRQYAPRRATTQRHAVLPISIAAHRVTARHTAPRHTATPRRSTQRHPCICAEIFNATRHFVSPRLAAQRASPLRYTTQRLLSYTISIATLRVAAHRSTSHHVAPPRNTTLSTILLRTASPRTASPRATSLCHATHIILPAQHSASLRYESRRTATRHPATQLTVFNFRRSASPRATTHHGTARRTTPPRNATLHYLSNHTAFTDLEILSR